MTDYIREILEEMNPCEPEPDRPCKYGGRCFHLRGNSERFLCISNLSYQTALYSKNGDVKKEKKDLIEFMKKNINSKKIILADPKEKKWKYKNLDKAEIETITNEIINRAQKIYDLACFIKSQKTS